MEQIKPGVFIHGYQKAYPWIPIRVPAKNRAWWAERKPQEQGQLFTMARFLAEASQAEQWVGLSQQAILAKLSNKSRKSFEGTLSADLMSLQQSGLIVQETNDEEAIYFPTPLLTAMLAFEEAEEEKDEGFLETEEDESWRHRIVAVAILILIASASLLWWLR